MVQSIVSLICNPKFILNRQDRQTDTQTGKGRQTQQKIQTKTDIQKTGRQTKTERKTDRQKRQRQTDKRRKRQVD